MRSRSVAISIAVAVLFGVGAGGSFVQARKLRGDAEWLMARGNAQAQEYAATLDSEKAQHQLSTFAERRTVLERAHIWQRLQYLLTLATVVALFVSYTFFLHRRLREQLLDVSADLSH